MDAPFTAFVGDDRQRLVAELAEAYERVRVAGPSRLYALLAPTGWGKSRVVQEVYARLAAGGAYWPPRISDGASSWLHARKRVFPAPFEVPADTPIPFLWLGISCQRDQMGRELAALQYAEHQIQAHVGSMVGALAGRGDRWKTRLGALGAVAGLVGLPDPVNLAMTWHGVATSTWGLLSQEWSAFAGRRAAAQSRHIDVEGTRREADRAAELADQLAHVSGGDLPIVLVIDDAHWADPGTVRLVDHLLTSPGRVLILATGWPDQVAIQNDVPGTFGDALDRWTRAGLARRRELTRLSDDALVTLVRSTAPDADPALLDALCERAGGNPNRLRGLLSLRAVRRALESGGGSLDTAQIAALPTGDEEIVHAIWRELPEPVREVLALSSIQGPRFNPDWIPAAAELIHLTDADEGLSAARAPWGWVRSVDAALDTFTEPGLFERARGESRSLFLPDELARARGALLRWACQRKQQDDWDTLSTAARRAILEAHLLGADEGFLPLDEDVSDSVLQLVEHLRQGLEYARLVEVADKGIDWTVAAPAQRDTWWKLRLARARALGELGRVSEALRAFDAMIAEHAEQDGDGDFDARYLRFIRAHWLAEAGRYDEALDAYRNAVDDWTTRLGSEHPFTLDARECLATTLRATGRIGEAVAMQRAVLRDRERVLGAHHPDARRSRNEVALNLMALGRPEEALPVLEQLLADEVPVLGEEHPSVLVTRHNLASCLAGVGRLDHALREGEALIEAKRRVFGPDHPSTLAARSSHAVALADAGRMLEAMKAHMSVFEDRSRVLGADHPDTLEARHNAATAWAELGQWDEAIPMLEAVVEDRARILGSLNPVTILSLNNLAFCYREVGRAEEAEAAQEHVIAARSQTLGPDHPDTLLARRNLASARLQQARGAGDPEGIAAGRRAMEALMADEARVLGIDHPLATGTRELYELLTQGLG
ncbi:MAG: tetratricopeptide repeat protein [Gemmatimonadota bacterium]